VTKKTPSRGGLDFEAMEGYLINQTLDEDFALVALAQVAEAATPLPD
jgi:hypothetical protein